jgi:hypothetical protein
MDGCAAALHRAPAASEMADSLCVVDNLPAVIASYGSIGWWQIVRRSQLLDDLLAHPCS